MNPEEERAALLAVANNWTALTKLIRKRSDTNKFRSKDVPLSGPINETPALQKSAVLSCPDCPRADHASSPRIGRPSAACERHCVRRLALHLRCLVEKAFPPC